MRCESLINLKIENMNMGSGVLYWLFIKQIIITPRACEFLTHGFLAMFSSMKPALHPVIKWWVTPTVFMPLWHTCAYLAMPVLIEIHRVHNWVRLMNSFLRTHDRNWLVLWGVGKTDGKSTIWKKYSYHHRHLWDFVMWALVQDIPNSKQLH